MNINTRDLIRLANEIHFEGTPIVNAVRFPFGASESSSWRLSFGVGNYLFIPHQEVNLSEQGEATVQALSAKADGLMGPPMGALTFEFKMQIALTPAMAMDFLAGRSHTTMVTR